MFSHFYPHITSKPLWSITYCTFSTFLTHCLIFKISRAFMSFRQFGVSLLAPLSSSATSHLLFPQHHHHHHLIPVSNALPLPPPPSCPVPPPHLCLSSVRHRLPAAAVSHLSPSFISLSFYANTSLYSSKTKDRGELTFVCARVSILHSLLFIQVLEVFPKRGYPPLFKCLLSKTKSWTAWKWSKLKKYIQDRVTWAHELVLASLKFKGFVLNYNVNENCFEIYFHCVFL